MNQERKGDWLNRWARRPASVQHRFNRYLVTATQNTALPKEQQVEAKRKIDEIADEYVRGQDH